MMTLSVSQHTLFCNVWLTFATINFKLSIADCNTRSVPLNTDCNASKSLSSWREKQSTFKVLGCVQTDATLLTNNSQHCRMPCCVRCCMLLDVVASCCAKFETGRTFQPTTPNISFVPWSPKRSATKLDPFAPLFQHCWGHARSLRLVYKDLLVVSFPRCTAGPNVVGSCCIR